jgi:hypothetical protein
MIRSVGYQFLSPLLFWIWSLWLLHSHIGSMCVTKNALVSMQVCPICLTNAKDLAFGCGHMVRRNSESLLHSVFNNVMQPHPENMHGYLCFGCVWVLCEKKQCCRECGESLTRCPICRQPIRSKLRLFSGWMM